MKALAFFVFLSSIFSVWGDQCSGNVRAVLSSSTRNQQRFIESGFLPKLFAELIDIVHSNRVKIKNKKFNDIILQFDDDARNPHAFNLFELKNVVGVKVSDLFKHYGNLWDFIDPSGIIANKKPLTLEERYRISERIHLHLSGLIYQILREKNLSLEALAFQIRIGPEVFDDIIFNAKLPRLPLLLQILVRLDADVVVFFKNIEDGLEDVPLSAHLKKTSRPSFRSSKVRGRSARRRAAVLYATINSELEEIFRELHVPNKSSGVMRFKNAIYYRKYQEKRRLRKKPTFRKIPLDRIFQTARMLGIHPSAVLKYAGDLKSHVQLEGIETRTLLSNEKIDELLNHVRNYLAVMFKESGMTKEELAEAAQMNLRFIIDIDQRGLDFSYPVLESILQALGSDTIRFFEKMEREGVLDVHAVDSSFFLARENTFIGERILKIRKILLPFFSNPLLDKAITRETNPKAGEIFAQGDIHFKTVYKASKTASVSLSDLVSERPLDDLLDFRRAVIEPVSKTEIDQAQKVLTHLLLSEARRQKDINGLTIAELAVKSHLTVTRVRRILSGKFVPSYSTLRQLVENGFGIPLPRFLENFEDKMKSFDRIPFAPKNTLLELEGLYLSEKVKVRMRALKERFHQAFEFLKSINISSVKLEKATGIKMRDYKGGGNIDHAQIYTVVKFSHFLGISLRDFMGSRDFSEIVKPSRLVFQRLPNQRVRQAVGKIKDGVDQRRKSLGISTQDLAIMLAAPSEHKMAGSLLNPSVLSFPWYKYFQLTEILIREGEDDFFLLDEIGF